MAVSVNLLPNVGAAINLEKVIKELHSELEESKQQFWDLKEKFLTCKSTVFSLANQLEKYRKLQIGLQLLKWGMIVCFPSENDFLQNWFSSFFHQNKSYH